LIGKFPDLEHLIRTTVWGHGTPCRSYTKSWRRSALWHSAANTRRVGVRYCPYIVQYRSHLSSNREGFRGFHHSRNMSRFCEVGGTESGSLIQTVRHANAAVAPTQKVGARAPHGLPQPTPHANSPAIKSSFHLAEFSSCTMRTSGS
jgi:hypothetical protein